MSFTFLVGIDEVGRGPIAGPLCVGGCALVRTEALLFYKRIRGLRDSKQLSPRERERWALSLHKSAGLGLCRLASVFVSEKVIDAKGLGFALRSAVEEVLEILLVTPRDSFVMLDGTLGAPAAYPFQESVLGGDENEPLIAAASVIAKVRRDEHMRSLSEKYPHYGFERHKGYGTRVHYDALRKYGPCAVHRKSFLNGCVKHATS